METRTESVKRQINTHESCIELLKQELAELEAEEQPKIVKLGARWDENRLGETVIGCADGSLQQLRDRANEGSGIYLAADVNPFYSHPGVLVASGVYWGRSVTGQPSELGRHLVEVEYEQDFGKRETIDLLLNHANPGYVVAIIDPSGGGE